MPASRQGREARCGTAWRRGRAKGFSGRSWIAPKKCSLGLWARRMKAGIDCPPRGRMAFRDQAASGGARGFAGVRCCLATLGALGEIATARFQRMARPVPAAPAASPPAPSCRRMPGRSSPACAVAVPVRRAAVQAAVGADRIAENIQQHGPGRHGGGRGYRGDHQRAECRQHDRDAGSCVALARLPPHRPQA